MGLFPQPKLVSTNVLKRTDCHTVQFCWRFKAVGFRLTEETFRAARTAGRVDGVVKVADTGV